MAPSTERAASSSTSMAGWQEGAGSGGSPSCNSSLSRTFGERVGGIRRVRICRGTLKEARRAAQGASSGCASDGMSKFHPAFLEPAPSGGGGTSGGATSIGGGSRTFVQVVRSGEKPGSSSDCGEPRTDSDQCDSSHRSICRVGN